MTAVATDPLAFIYDPDVPLAMREALFDGLRSLPASVAIAHAVATEQQIRPWLALELALTVERGQQALLRYTACIPGVSLSAAVLPQDQRLNLEKTLRESQEAARRTEEWAAEAEASGNDVHVVSGK